MNLVASLILSVCCLMTTAEVKQAMVSNLIASLQWRLPMMEKLEAASQNLATWGKMVMPHYFKNTFSKQHLWFGAKLKYMAREERGASLCVEGPRGSAKSTLATTILPIFSVCENTEKYIVLCSDTTDQARKYLEYIAEELTTNDYIRVFYNHAFGTGPVWNKGAIVTRNGIRIEALGAGKKIRGRRHGEHRPSLIVVDDPEGEEAAFSIIKRQRIRDWYLKAVSKAGEPGTNLVVVGTRIHLECLTVTLSKLPGWQHKMFRSIMRWPDRMDLWAEWENIFADAQNPRRVEMAQQFYLEHKPEMHAGAEVLWPDREPLYALMCKRAAEGHANFESEKQNNPIDPSKCEWNPIHFDGDIFFDEWPQGCETKVMALDPSKGATDKPGDYSAIVKVALHAGLIYVDIDMARRDTTKIVDDCLAHMTVFQPEALAVETNSFQHLIAQAIVMGAEKLGGLPAPVVPLENTVKKEVRIRRLGPYISTRAFRYKSRSPGISILLAQLTQFPLGDHDDGPDALEMAIRILKVLQQGAQEAEPVTVHSGEVNA